MTVVLATASLHPFMHPQNTQWIPLICMYVSYLYEKQIHFTEVFPNSSSSERLQQQGISFFHRNILIY